MFLSRNMLFKIFLGGFQMKSLVAGLFSFLVSTNVFAITYPIYIPFELEIDQDRVAIQIIHHTVAEAKEAGREYLQKRADIKCGELRVATLINGYCPALQGVEHAKVTCFADVQCTDL